MIKARSGWGIGGGDRSAAADLFLHGEYGAEAGQLRSRSTAAARRSLRGRQSLAAPKTAADGGGSSVKVA